MSSINSLADLYLGLQRTKEAEALYIKSIEECVNVYSNDHTESISAIRTLAALYIEQERYAEAEALLLKSIERLTRLVGAEATDTLQTMNEIATLYCTCAEKTTDEDEAMKTYRKAEETLLEYLRRVRIALVRTKILPIPMPDLVLVGNVLLSLYYSQGRFDEAKGLQKEYLSGFKTTLRAAQRRL
jgi:tetratricopeptide (TPR) repeat protein